MGTYYLIDIVRFGEPLFKLYLQFCMDELSLGREA
jgi:hypothetical protein